MKNVKERLLKLSELYAQAAENENGFSVRVNSEWENTNRVPDLYSDLYLWKVNPPTPDKIIDLSSVAGSDILCEFSNINDCWYIGKLIQIFTEIPEGNYFKDNTEGSEHMEKMQNITKPLALFRT